ncbi:hypothetical protein MRB53_037462 [Persea americana]|nr:hypothetical protein MRB53_037462 [Persea americana]
MATAYLQFLKSPSAAALSDKASLSYITTTTVISEPEAIVKHFTAQSRQLSKDDKVLHIIESSNGASIETETTLKFKTGGGAYLPGIDDNLLDERTVTFPVVHIVAFDAQQKISQIRLYWEQGTLLKQIEAIGRNGKNWPIRTGDRLIEAVKTSIKSSVENGTKGQDLPIREQSNISATRDPHASLQLFSPQDPNQDSRKAYDGPAVAPRASARPAPRDYGDLFVGEATADSPSQKRSSSPSKIDGRSVKAGASSKFQPNRLFDENIPMDAPQSPEKKKTYGQKYDHFAFGDGEDATHARHASKSGSSNKSVSHFQFEDFSTPLKIKEKSRPDQERHWGKPDADTHYKISDESPGLPAEKRRPTTNVDAARRGQDFGAHYTIVDKSPAGAPTPKPKVAARQELQPSWGFSEPTVEKKIYKTAGDGMGGRGARAWGIGDESDPEIQEKERRGRRAQAKAGADE